MPAIVLFLSETKMSLFAVGVSIYLNVDELSPQWRRVIMAHKRQRVENEESFGNCVMASIAALSLQGCHIHSHLLSVRLLILSFLVFGMIMTSAYSATLVSQVGHFFITYWQAMI